MPVSETQKNMASENSKSGPSSAFQDSASKDLPDVTLNTSLKNQNHSSSCCCFFD